MHTTGQRNSVGKRMREDYYKLWEKKITLVVEPQCFGFEHAPVNAAVFRAL